MKTADTPTPAGHASRPCPPWCATRHDHDLPDNNYRTHRSTPLTAPGGLYATVSQDEPLHERAAYLAAGAVVYFAVDGAEGVRMPVRQARSWAFLLSRLGESDAARLLGEAVTLIRDGAS